MTDETLLARFLSVLSWIGWSWLGWWALALSIAFLAGFLNGLDVLDAAHASRLSALSSGLGGLLIGFAFGNTLVRRLVRAIVHRVRTPRVAAEAP